MDQRPFPNSAIPVTPPPPPAYDNVENSSAMASAVVSEHVPSGHYATVGGANGHPHDVTLAGDGSASGGPIYSNSTIRDLASGVQLPGAEAARQSDI